MNRFQKAAVFVLVFLTLITRLVTLSRVPPHLSNDEISIAYDSYSIRHTARDEHNNFLPVSFQSHNTYKAPLYVYLATITNYFLGNSEFSVRLPSAILGSLTVFVFGYIIFLLSKNINLSIISVGVLSLTPWHIYTSRMALESNIAVIFLATALLIFFKSIINNNNHFLILSMIFFASSIWAYHTEWLLTPMIMFSLFYIYRKKIKLNATFWLGILIFFIFVFPIAYNAWINRGTTARANTEIIFNDPGISKILKSTDVSIIKKTIVVGKSLFKNYSDYTKLGHLFFDGLSLLPKEDPYSVGLFLLPLLPFFLWGFFKIKLYFPSNYKFIYFWIIVSPIVPSLTIGGTNMIRNLATVLPYSLIIGVGLYDLKSRINIIKYWILVMSILISILYFFAIYFYHFPFQMGENFQYGYKQAAEFIEENYDRYDQIIVDPRFGDVNIYVGVPHLYLAYFTNLDPRIMLLRRDNEKGLLFDKYHIFEINWNLEKVLPKSLYLVPFDNLPGDNFNNLRTVKEIKLPNYKVEFKLLESI